MLIHKPIYQAIAGHDPEAARQAMVHHFNELRKTLGVH
jgi:DNA-binding FadR family transcriptional regulator